MTHGLSPLCASATLSAMSAKIFPFYGALDCLKRPS
jgi:hypothetical protein